MLLNPLNNTNSFGIIAPLTLGEIKTVSSSIRLFNGNHYGPNKGFGASHILHEHKKDIQNFYSKHYNTHYNISDIDTDNVRFYVGTILSQGTNLYFSGESFKRKRVMAFKGAFGSGILEYQPNGNKHPIWSVVTAYHCQNHRGTRIGKIL